MTSTPDTIPGAEALDLPGGSVGVLVLHGFSSTPQSMSLLVSALGAAGFTVVAPLLPGHGTTVEDLATTTWDDWTSAASHALQALRTRCDRVAVAGLSMGGGIAAWLAEHDDRIAGLILINSALAPVLPAATVDPVRAAIAQGVCFVPGVATDVAEPMLVEIAYDRISLAAALSLDAGLAYVAEQLPLIRCPVLLVSSVNDHAVPAGTLHAMANRISGDVTRVTLERSFHLATIDVEHADVEQHAVAFLRARNL